MHVTFVVNLPYDAKRRGGHSRLTVWIEKCSYCINFIFQVPIAQIKNQEHQTAPTFNCKIPN